MSEINKLKENIKTKLYISVDINKESEEAFKKDLQRMEKEIKSFYNYALVFLYLQLGTADKTTQKVFEHRANMNCYLVLQPKIKNYIPFKDKESMEEYIKNQIPKDTLYMVHEVELR